MVLVQTSRGLVEFSLGFFSSGESNVITMTFSKFQLLLWMELSGGDHRSWIF